MHEVLVNRLGGLSLPRKSVVRLTDRPDMTLDVYCGRKTTIQPTISSYIKRPNCLYKGGSHSSNGKCDCTKKTYERYKQEVRAYKEITDLAKNKQAIAVTSEDDENQFKGKVFHQNLSMT